MHVQSLMTASESLEAAQSFDDAKRLFEEGSFGAASEMVRALDASLRARARSLADRGVRPELASVIVVTYGDRPDYQEALERLARSTVRNACEFILVDNGSECAREIWNAVFPNSTILDVGFNYGCSGGRNLGAEIANGRYVAFIDDDGFVTPECIERLIGALEEDNAVAVRGRVLPKTPGGAISTTYDLGLHPIPAAITAEGVSAFRRAEFLDADGFDPLLAGHEGALLSTRLYRTYGPPSLLYEPAAILYHDYSTSLEGAAEKKIAQDRNNAYVIHQEPAYSAILASLRNITQRELAAHHFLARHRYSSLTDWEPEVSPGNPVSIITTAHNARSFVEPFRRSLLSQTSQAFELVFVDDGSTDGTAQAVRLAFADDARLKLIETPHVGRAEALNVAVGSASNEICLIADVDDISLPYRIRASREILSADQSLDCISLLMFDNRTSYLLGRPHQPHVVDFFARALFGMPAPFPAFAFRRSRFKESFDPTITGGVDYDWLARNILAHGVRGRIVPIHGTYYYRHEGQISATRQDQQKLTAIRCLTEFHRRLIPTMTAEDERLATTLAGWTPAGVRDVSALKGYAFRLAASAAASDPELAQAVTNAMFARVTEIELALARVATTSKSPHPTARATSPDRKTTDRKARASKWPEPPWPVLVKMLLRKVTRRLRHPLRAKPRTTAVQAIERAASRGAWPEPPWPVLIKMLVRKSKRQIKRSLVPAEKSGG